MEILKTTLIGLFFGTFGTTIGGIIGIFLKKKSNKFLSFILSFASGLMMAIICFDLIPEALGISNILNILLGIGVGIIVMILCDLLVEKKFNTNQVTKLKNNNLLKTGIVVSIGLAIHNFPEGLAIGSGFEASLKLGLSLAIAICLHDIPEVRFQSRHQVKNARKTIWIQIYSIKKYGILDIFSFERNAIGMKIENADIWVLTEEWCHILMCGGKDALS